MIEFELASKNDVSIIVTIARKTWPNTFENIMSKEQIEYMLDLVYNPTAITAQMKSGQNFHLIKHKQIPVGFTAFETNYEDKPQLMIHKVYLLPSVQGLGIGKSTFDHLTRIALANNQSALTLKVHHKNQKAIGFYEKKGFVIHRTEKTQIGNHYEILDYVMTKKLREFE
ncbi:MAG: GNAT family N-acetyltransferase [Allomuricauda sp.]